MALSGLCKTIITGIASVHVQANRIVKSVNSSRDKELAILGSLCVDESLVLCIPRSKEVE